jgi:hypothetical protein
LCAFICQAIKAAPCKIQHICNYMQITYFSIWSTRQRNPSITFHLLFLFSTEHELPTKNLRVINQPRLQSPSRPCFGTWHLPPHNWNTNFLTTVLIRYLLILIMCINFPICSINGQSNFKAQQIHKHISYSHVRSKWANTRSFFFFCFFYFFFTSLFFTSLSISSWFSFFFFIYNFNFFNY